MGEQASQPESGRQDPTSETAARLAAAHSEAQHWRELAATREANLRALTRRPIVRFALRLDRRVSPVRRRVRAWASFVRSLADKTAVLGAGLSMLPSRPGRRANLSRELDRLGSVACDRHLTVIAFDTPLGDTWSSDSGMSPEMLVVTAGPRPIEPEVALSIDPTGRSRTAALNMAAARASGEVLCFAPSAIDAPASGWLARLAAALTDEVVAATPTLMHPQRRGPHVTEHDLLVRSQGLEIETDPEGAPLIAASGAGARADVRREPDDVIAAPLQCLVVDADAFRRVGGFDETVELDDVAAVDLCTRLRRTGGRVRHVPSAVVFDHRPVRSRGALRRPVDPDSASWRRFVEHHGPAVLREGRSSAVAPLRWVLTTAAPSKRVAERWGDWHLAEGLARSLRQLGQDVHVQTYDQADSLAARSRDVHLVLHGLAPVRRTRGQHHIIWVISHPETLDLAECDAADLLLVASPRFAASLRERTSTPVEVFLQATDPNRFSPQAPRPEHSHAVTVVAKTREVMRRSVAFAVAAGIRPAIYGGGWRKLVDSSLVVSDHIDNDVLPAVYNSAGVVLNDHWDTMRDWGFVSNRIFDVLACGTPIISDDMPEIHEIFGAAVPTYRTSAELGDLVQRTLVDPDGARSIAAEGRAVVLAHHTFGHRAKELLQLLDRYRLRDASA